MINEEPLCVSVEFDGEVRWRINGAPSGFEAFSTGNFSHLERIQRALAFALETVESELRIRHAIPPSFMGVPINTQVDGVEIHIERKSE